MERREKRIVWGCIAGFVGVALLMAGGCAFVVVRALQGHGVGLPGRELAQYRERYGDITAKAQAVVDARRKAQKEALTAARAAVPVGASIPADWDLDKALKKAWLPVEQKTLDELARVLVSPVSEREPSRDETIEYLKERLGMVRQAGNITPLEARFDPNQHGAEGVFEHFREFVVTADFLNELEAAIDLGLCEGSRESASDEEDNEARRSLAACLLACRARFLSERGEREKALKTCLRLYKFADALNQDVTAGFWSSDPSFMSAHFALESCLCSGPMPPDWRVQFLASAERRRESELFCDKLRVHAASNLFERMEMEQEDAIQLRGGGLGAYRAYEQAEALIALLDRPYYESADQVKTIQDKFGMGRFGNKDGGEESPLDGIAFALDVMFGGVDTIMASSLIEDLIFEFRYYARASMEPDVLRLVFALVDYKAENGSYPRSLDELTPKWLESAPVDALTGKPLIYEVSEKGYTLKAVSGLYEPDKEELHDIWEGF